jgi:hypothetical protein
MSVIQKRALFLKISAFCYIAPCWWKYVVGLCPSETSVYCSEVTRRCIPEVCHLHTRCRENLKCHSLLDWNTLKEELEFRKSEYYLIPIYQLDTGCVWFTVFAFCPYKWKLLPIIDIVNTIWKNLIMLMFILEDCVFTRLHIRVQAFVHLVECLSYKIAINMWRWCIWAAQKTLYVVYSIFGPKRVKVKQSPYTPWRRLGGEEL